MQALGLQLTARSIHRQTDKSVSSKPGISHDTVVQGNSSLDRSDSDRGGVHSSSSSSSSISIREILNKDYGADNTQVKKSANKSTDAGRKGGPTFGKALSTATGKEQSTTADKAGGRHQCWQPVLLAYGDPGRGSKQTAAAREGAALGRGSEQSAPAREVMRSRPAELSLWAVEAAGKHIGVLSDPSCVLHLR